MLGILGGLARAFLPLAAQKLATIPFAQKVFKTIQPIMSMAAPVLSQAFENQEQ
jgi:hypothetical protein